MAKLDLDPIENASTELFIADVMLRASELFVIETRGWVKPMPQSEAAMKVLCDLDTMLAELSDKVHAAKDMIDGFVEAEMAERRAGLNRTDAN